MTGELSLSVVHALLPTLKRFYPDPYPLHVPRSVVAPIPLDELIVIAWKRVQAHDGSNTGGNDGSIRFGRPQVQTMRG